MTFFSNTSLNPSPLTVSRGSKKNGPIILVPQMPAQHITLGLLWSFLSRTKPGFFVSHILNKPELCDKNIQQFYNGLGFVLGLTSDNKVPCYLCVDHGVKTKYGFVSPNDPQIKLRI